MEGITVHCMVRNEPFVYYAVKSVYDYVDVVLLYDTGSYDKYTISDIQRLLHEDSDNKIVFKQVEIDVDETGWTNSNWQKFAHMQAGKKGKWFCRRMQIHDTTTKYFMILDGDEIHYQRTMKQIVSLRWPREKACGFLPLVWFKDMNHTFNLTYSGRLFLTEFVDITPRSPGEIHTYKGQRIGRNSACAFKVSDVTPFAHFETMLKPWRRRVKQVEFFEDKLPEVMIQDMSLVERFQDEVLNR